jgi:hypothetical protein
MKFRFIIPIIALIVLLTARFAQIDQHAFDVLARADEVGSVIGAGADDVQFVQRNVQVDHFGQHTRQEASHYQSAVNLALRNCQAFHSHEMTGGDHLG